MTDYIETQNMSAEEAKKKQSASDLTPEEARELQKESLHKAVHSNEGEIVPGGTDYTTTGKEGGPSSDPNPRNVTDEEMEKRELEPRQPIDHTQEGEIKAGGTDYANASAAGSDNTASNDQASGHTEFQNMSAAEAKEKQSATNISNEEAHQREQEPREPLDHSKEGEIVPGGTDFTNTGKEGGQSSDPDPRNVTDEEMFKREHEHREPIDHSKVGEIVPGGIDYTKVEVENKASDSPNEAPNSDHINTQNMSAEEAKGKQAASDLTLEEAHQRQQEPREPIDHSKEGVAKPGGTDYTESAKEGGQESSDPDPRNVTDEALAKRNQEDMMREGINHEDQGVACPGGVDYTGIDKEGVESSCPDTKNVTDVEMEKRGLEDQMRGGIDHSKEGEACPGGVDYLGCEKKTD